MVLGVLISSVHDEMTLMIVVRALFAFMAGAVLVSFVLFSIL